jgi:hypothetical protein
MTMAPALFHNVYRFCTRNMTLKLLSLAVAVCIWSFTAVSRETHYDLVLPLELRNIPPGYIVAGQPPGEVRFTLTGPSILIDGARRSNSSMMLNLRGAAPGRVLFSHLESNLKLPDGINVTRVSPASLEINLVLDQRNPSEGDNQQ